MSLRVMNMLYWLGALIVVCLVVFGLVILLLT